MMDFNLAFERLLGNEGGLVSNPADPGGLTRYGISQRSYPDVDIRNLTEADARAIYQRDFWNVLGADQYDGAIGFQLFDIAVNSGVRNAARMLQRAVGAVDDGVVGPKTRAAVAAMPVPAVLLKLNAERIEFYTGNQNWLTFGKGWSNRVANNLRLAAEDL